MKLILLLNGVPSAGKTSIAQAFQKREDHAFFVLSNDMFEEMINDHHILEDYWNHFYKIVGVLYRTVLAFAQSGYKVIIDGMILERQEFRNNESHYNMLRHTLRSCNLRIVEIYCPLDVCRRRNRARGNRYEGISDDYSKCMSSDVMYDFRVDTDVLSPHECCDRIIEFCVSKGWL